MKKLMVKGKAKEGTKAHEKAEKKGAKGVKKFVKFIKGKK